MCLWCAEGRADLASPADAARRARVLRLLALVEMPDALPAEAALRLAGEILRLTETDRAAFRCEAVEASGPNRPEGRRP